MAGFIDIACNFTHESFKHNLEEVISNAEHEGVDKFVLLCASLADIDPIKVIQDNAPEKYFISAGIHPHHATEILEINYDALLNKLKSISPVTTLKTAAGIRAPPGEPETSLRLLFSSKIIIGVIVLMGLLPGSNLLPILAERSVIAGSPNWYAKLFI